jgi:hypothetical protein
LFVLSILVVAGSLLSAAWLLVSRQADTFDGLFLFLSSLVMAGAFSLYLKFLISNALRELREKDKKTAPSGASQPPLGNRTAA